jgi:DNA topoisomerase-1
MICIKRYRVHIRTTAKEVLAKNDDEWFKGLTKEQQKQYLEEHPNSKFAKTFKAKEDENGQSGSKKTGPAKVKKEKTDPYKDVPEEDKKVMLAAKTRGYRVPPAWRNVWLNPNPKADLQVKGKDAKGRTQSVYTASFRAAQDIKKFNRLRDFTKAYKGMRTQIDKDFDESPEAQCLYLIAKTGFRIGSSKETGAKVKAYGASTLTVDHISIDGDIINFDFTGKKGVHQKHEIVDAKLAKMLSTKKEGLLFETNGAKIHKYLESLNPEQKFEVKDFRTYVATSTALSSVSSMEAPRTKAEYIKSVNKVCKTVSEKLGNSPDMAKKSYIDPTVFKEWQSNITDPDVETSSDSIGPYFCLAMDKEQQLMQDFIECNHYRIPDKVVIALKRVIKLPRGKDREIAYSAFQKLAKVFNLVDTSSKKVYIDSLREIEKIARSQGDL